MKLNKKGFGLVELMILLAVLVFIADIAYPHIHKYISLKKEEQESSAILEVAILNIKTYVKSVNEKLTYIHNPDGSYYIKNVDVDLSGCLPEGLSWIVIEDNKIVEGCFKIKCTDNSYTFIKYDGESYTIIDVEELPIKP